MLWLSISFDLAVVLPFQLPARCGHVGRRRQRRAGHARPLRVVEDLPVVGGVSVALV